ncbi:nuclear body protein SP140-like protein [Simochromis diagramma]|uniref:nuclear body protein SP140-like protein n=1 Tax=Simochromis diagramma TaxID=43689 RepID=UPI001A7EA303|nr:nuclear body protein SP140-like protein [Simochromis diagramma]
MDPLDFLELEEMRRFLHCNKTEISCMEDPVIFLCKLKDYNLISEDSFKKVSRMKKKEKGLYDILDWFEKKKSEHIKLFWKCAFKETVLSHNPKLQMLRKSLMDGSYHFDTQLPEKVETEDNGEKEKTEHSEEEAREKNSVKKKRKYSKSICDEEDEQPGPSGLSTSAQKKSKKICFTPPMKKGEKGEIWTWPLYKSQLPVTCGQMSGTLQRDKLAKGEKCILANKQWFAPGEFERFAGKQSCKNWKLSIRCGGTPLGKLIKEGHLKTVAYKGGNKKAKKKLFSLEEATTESEKEEDDEEDQDSSSDEPTTDEEEAEEQAVQQPEAGLSNTKVFKVTCGGLAGTLHKKRFASGTLGKSIRTETSWMTPVDFCKESGPTNVSWKKDIRWDGKPLSALMEAEILKIHSLLCACPLCKPDPEDLENEKNDDECCICKNEEEDQELVVCEECPRSFHQKCHLPHVDDIILNDDSPWLCTFCVFRANHVCLDQLEVNAVMSQQISQHMMQCQYLLLSLRSADEEQMFSPDPMGYLANYSTSIKSPMWLGKVTEKLQQKQYQTVGEFVSDVQLIFANCAAFNRGNPEILAIGNQLRELFDSEFKKAFNIQDQ